MKKKILLTSTAVAALSLATPVFAADSGGFFLEPMVTYETGDGDANFPGPVGTTNSDVDGFGAGLRLGGHVGDILFLGVDGRYSFPTLKSPNLNLDVDADQWNVGALIGAQMPWLVGLRVWGNYIFAGELDPDAQGILDSKFTDANGWRAGAGLRVAFASLNIEYQDLDYDETEISGINLGGVQQNQQSWIFSVSFPFSM